MFTKICYGLALAIVVSIIPLSLGRLGSETPSTEQFPNVAPTSAPSAPALVQQAPASGSATKTPLPASQPETSARREVTFQLQQYPEDVDPWNRGYAIRVRLDIACLRAHDLTDEDVKKAMMQGCSAGDSPRRPDPSPGVVYFPRVNPDQVENLILKASPDGEIVRLKDVAKIDGGWSIFDVAHWLFGI